MKKRRVLIFSGGRLGDWAVESILPGDYLIGADRGALFLVERGIRPDLALGDFDSVTVEERERIRTSAAEFRDFDPVAKDWTDTELAFHTALDMRPHEILLLGALGSRFDHSLANVHLLRRGLEMGVPAVILDESNEIRLVNREVVLEKSRFPYVSLLPLTLKATGITLTGFRYPLNNAELAIGQSLGISNELISSRGTVAVSDGLLLVIRSTG
jgi:thiamine pyrophosphokinase